MEWFYMQTGTMPLPTATLAVLYPRSGKHNPPEKVSDRRLYYDGNGNHVYYGYRLTTRPEKEEEEEQQEDNH